LNVYKKTARGGLFNAFKFFVLLGAHGTNRQLRVGKPICESLDQFVHISKNYMKLSGNSQYARVERH